MKTYSEEFKNGIIARMLPPRNESVPDISAQTGIPKDTLYSWRIMARKAPENSKGVIDLSGRGLSSEDKFNIVVETAGMNEEEMSTYCRQKGLYPDQIRSWRRSCIKANEAPAKRVDIKKVQEQEKENRQLKSELRRKEKALAETAALLVLKKKVQEIWGENEADR